ncbi:MAG TPA: hypothetical protein VFB38_17980 [Chthonomonadaceae bacterium]|nr:hypothetical protein [Chthonomonadaceae bacterium]
MKNWIARGTMSVALLALVSSLAVAAPPKKAKKPAAVMMCPACKMPLSAKKTDKNPTAVYIKGKTMYCCSACKMDKSLTTKPGKSGHAAHSAHKGGKH